MKVIGELPMSREDIQRILAAPIVYSNKSNPKEEEQVQVRTMRDSRSSPALPYRCSYTHHLDSTLLTTESI
jgi:hypothetical protein